MQALRELLAAQYGEQLTKEIVTGYEYVRPVSLRVNTGKTDVEAVKSALAALGIAFETVPWYEDALVLSGVREEAVARTELYRNGEIYLQSLSSMLPPLYLNPQAGESVLDMTAAPGGKTTELYALSGGKALITACERDKTRYQRLLYNLNRQGATRVTALCTDAATLNDFFSFDKILLDAPCSGSGTVYAGKPARIDAQYVERCANMQGKLLKKAIKLLRHGGTMVYSTCSILRRENEEILERGLKGTGAELVPIAPMQGLPVLPSGDGTLCVKPNELFEGFFVAKIHKK